MYDMSALNQMLVLQHVVKGYWVLRFPVGCKMSQHVYDWVTDRLTDFSLEFARWNLPIASKFWQKRSKSKIRDFSYLTSSQRQVYLQYRKVDSCDAIRNLHVEYQVHCSFEIPCVALAAYVLRVKPVLVKLYFVFHSYEHQSQFSRALNWELLNFS